MAQFKPNSETKVDAAEPRLDVLVTTANPLKVGKHVFRLIVKDDAGNDSLPASVTLIVTDTTRPTAVVDVLDASGGRISTPEVTIPFGRAFTLTGERSSDVGGEVKLWQWELLQG